MIQVGKQYLVVWPAEVVKMCQRHINELILGDTSITPQNLSILQLNNSVVTVLEISTSHPYGIAAGIRGIVDRWVPLTYLEEIIEI